MQSLNWSQVSVAQYEEIQEAITSEGMTPTSLILEVGDILFDLPEELDEEELDTLRQCVMFIGKPCKATTHKSIRIYDSEFTLKNFRRLTLGQFIELDVMLIDTQFFEVVKKCAMYLYGIPADMGDKVDETSIALVIGAVNDFVKYRVDTYKSYPNIFDMGDDDEEDEEDEDYDDDEEDEKADPRATWLRTVFALTKGDITKYTHVIGLPHRLVFNWVSLSESLKPRQQSGSEPDH